MAEARRSGDPLKSLGDEPHWYKDAIIYEAPVRAFFDSDADGVGDFKGLTEKLSYIQDLGVTALWILPFYRSPLKDNGYDIADFREINSLYGTRRDFKRLLREAHRRGIRVISELVLNHTSDQHPWFQRARRASPGSRDRDFYVWSDDPDKYSEARVIFRDFEPSNWRWDPVANAYYWHRFYSHQPDLNYDNPAVRRAMLAVLDFWFSEGVDGFRLDAVPYLYEREGTNCENLTETHEFLKELRTHVDAKYPDKMLLAEANQWPDEASAYFGDGDECNMAFHFPLMPRLFMAIRLEDRYPIIEILEQTPDIPESCQWALFLRNHDELTLEMVTDEERDYMYRIYAADPRGRVNLGIRRRLAPLLDNNRRRVELMTALLFSMPGTPVLYYGDEIGMGDNIYLGDRDSVRTPMQWSGDRNAGFSRANPQKLHLPVVTDPGYHYEAVNVEAQQSNPHSLLWWMKRLIALRKRYRAFGRGTTEFLDPENRKVLVFIRRHGDERILVVANLSRFVQNVEIDLSAYEGLVPVEMFGGTPFPAVGELPYFITLGPHAFYWFALEAPAVEPEAATALETGIPTLRLAATGADLLRGRPGAAIESVLQGYLQARRWFGGKARTIRSVSIAEALPMGRPHSSFLTILRVEYTHGEPESYVLPLGFAGSREADRILRDSPQAAVAWIENEKTGAGHLAFDALWDADFCGDLLRAISGRRRTEGAQGDLVATPTRALTALRSPANGTLAPSVLEAEQSNSSVTFGDRLILKLFRRLDEGVNPELEVGRFLTERTDLARVPAVAGSLEYRRHGPEPQTVAVLQHLVPNEGDAWSYTVDQLEEYFERALATQPESHGVDAPLEHELDLAEAEVPEDVAALIGPYLESAQLLGLRTAELHVALASSPDDAVFAPEPVTPFYQRSLYQSMRALAIRTLRTLRQQLPQLPEHVQADAQRVLDSEADIIDRLDSVKRRKISGSRIRCHGDLHLGQILYTGKDFVIIDFEGEPARPLGERRIKRTALRDVAGILRSFHYAALAAQSNQTGTNVIRREDVPELAPWARLWYAWVGATFLKAYLARASSGTFLPENRDDLRVLLDANLLDKAMYELGYELNSRPDWVGVPLHGILDLLALESAPTHA